MRGVMEEQEAVQVGDLGWLREQKVVETIVMLSPESSNKN